MANVDPHRLTRPWHAGMSEWLEPANIGSPFQLSKVQTALEFWPVIGDRLGIRLYLKREDEADALGCGHKLRKLSFLAPAFVSAGASVLVTVGSLPSNQCKAVARAARMCGLRAHLVYLGDQQERPVVARGNYRITSLLGATVTWREWTPWAQAADILTAVVAEEEAAGECPVLLPSGLSQDEGLLASVELGYEIDSALGADKQGRVGIVAAAGSGGTCLGLKLASERMGRNWDVYGCLVGETKDAVRTRIAEFRSRFAARFGWGGADDGKLSIVAEAVGRGYNRSEPHEIETMARIARDYGLLFDLNYMVKTFCGLESLAASGKLDHLDCVVLVHSGGQIGAFDEHDDFSSWHSQNLPMWTAPGALR